MVLKITNLHILRYLPTCWLYLLECYTIDNQRCTHTAQEKYWKPYILSLAHHWCGNSCQKIQLTNIKAKHFHPTLID